MSKKFEDFLQEKHGGDFVGTKDMMIDDYENWLENVTIDEWIEYADAFKKQSSSELLAVLKEISEGKEAYNEDKLLHASNCITNMKEIAKKAINKEEA